MPLVILTDGELLECPNVAALAGRIGLQTQANQPFYDRVIGGRGLAGLAAAVYGASEAPSQKIGERPPAPNSG